MESSPEDETHGNCKHSKMFLIPCPKLMDSFTQHRCFFVARKILVFQLASLHWSTNQPTLLPLHLFTYFPPPQKKRKIGPSGEILAFSSLLMPPTLAPKTPEISSSKVPQKESEPRPGVFPSNKSRHPLKNNFRCEAGIHEGNLLKKICYLMGFAQRKILIYQNMGVSKNRGTPKWMVYNGKAY